MRRRVFQTAHYIGLIEQYESLSRDGRWHIRGYTVRRMTVHPPNPAQKGFETLDRHGDQEGEGFGQTLSARTCGQSLSMGHPVWRKIWRWAYHFMSKQKLMMLEKYHDVSLARARERHALHRTMGWRSFHYAGGAPRGRA